MRKWFFMMVFGMLCVASITATEAFPPRWRNAVSIRFQAGAGGVNGLCSSRGLDGTAWQYMFLYKSTAESGSADSASICLYPVSGDQDSVLFVLSYNGVTRIPFSMYWNMPVSDIRVQTHSVNACVYVLIKD